MSGRKSMYRISDSIITNPQRWAFATLAVALAFIALVDVRPAVQNWAAAPGEIGELRAAVLTVPAQIAGMVVPAAQQEIRHATDTLIAEVRGARADVLGQVDATRIEILGPAGRWVGLQQSVLSRADYALSIIEATRKEGVQPVLDAAAGTIRDLQPTLANAASITAHADVAAAILFRRDALPAQLLGLTAAGKVTLGEAAQTMRTVRDAAPLFVSQGQQITTNFGAITSNINRLTKPHWYDRLLGYGLNGAVLYRQLNPVTNLTVKGAALVSGQN